MRKIPVLQQLLLRYSFFSVYLVVGADGEKVARFIRKVPAKSTVCIHYGLLIYTELSRKLWISSVMK